MPYQKILKKKILSNRIVVGKVFEINNYGIYIKIKNFSFENGFVSDFDLNIDNTFLKKKKYSLETLHVFRVIKIDINKKIVILTKKKLHKIEVLKCLKTFYVYKKIQSLYVSISNISNLNVYFQSFLVNFKKIYQKELKGLIEFVNNPKKFKKKFFNNNETKKKIFPKIFYYIIRKILLNKFIQFGFFQTIKFKFYFYYYKGINDYTKILLNLQKKYLKLSCNCDTKKYNKIKIINYTPLISLKLFYIIIAQFIHSQFQNTLIVNI
uniref:S1 motif domain-containing protein n=1 Tax=Lotharella vacuolata TaxID=74820 RepID=A0A0H5BH67_9EUKA|nr:hypothetical protein [Lotharella vacuolata]